MKPNQKTKALLIACIVIVATFSLIQYYLVLNTYKLTKDNYYAEVKRTTNKIASSQAIADLEDKAFENLKHAVTLYTSGKLNKGDFIVSLNKWNDSVKREADKYLNKTINKDPALSGVRYKFQYEQISIENGGKPDVLLSSKENPLVIIGSAFHTANTILLNQGKSLSLINRQVLNEPNNSYNESLRLAVIQSQYIDVSNWRKEVFKRMMLIFILATSLILAVIILFYFVFSALIKQKKIAQIKTDFANNITHELKTPLSSVNIILKSLEKKEVRNNPELFDNLLQTLVRQHVKINSLVDSVLESALAADFKFEKQEVEITRFLHDYVRDLKLADHQFCTTIEESRQTVYTHMASLEKVLNNLVENAVKYSEPGTTISLNSSIADKEYIIEVVDEGPGIASSYQQQVFEKFFRISEHNRHDVKGLGLGLFLSKETIAQLGGTLVLQSKPGQGCTFIIKLPI